MVKTCYVLPTRCYDKDSYPSSSNDEFIVPVSLGANLGATHPGSSSQPGTEVHLNVAKESIEAVKFVVEAYNHQEDDEEYYKVVQVHEASSQVRSYFLLSLLLFRYRRLCTLLRKWYND